MKAIIAFILGTIIFTVGIKIKMLVLSVLMIVIGILLTGASLGRVMDELDEWLGKN